MPPPGTLAVRVKKHARLQLLESGQRWYRLVNVHEARSLGFETDRRFALAALAQEIETRLWKPWATGITTDLYVAPS
ncbi:hypothetical protein SBOR_2838 [Sclerotinia borealis F-4128]|uniref:Uncharacterized protein n=1 Tax=Sclerotinia borealis (strain F-4128) TaxID=1432307 RepID=W9CL80_SCLBF|nr:hypothetical protein SBOR_2838 [Sclerotinia borealis F-4128]